MTRLLLVGACLGALVSFSTPARAEMSGMDMGGATEAAPFGAPVDDQHVFSHVMLNQFEGRLGRDTSFRWEGEAWAGTDSDRVLLRSEGEVSNGNVEEGQQELFYSRPISTYFNAQGGLRYDLDSRPGRGWLAFGIEGLAPLFFHVAATGYASDKGHYGAKLEGSYDQLLTQRLVLQPQVEMNFYSKDDPARLTGTGLSDIDMGLRLRYEFSRKFAPYIGVTYVSKFGGTADFVRAAGESVNDVRFTAGLRVWF
ncbi:MAG: copper resistance protein B [Alphaproteobacteria bacterium]|nr:copper resistance protein B [Reyranella sp.]MBL6940061.1 copper resistance protein B [Alphaproteobacteria bacterium]MBL7100148.1 copper resistance protein B [Alphaproteobacteria bacterium]